MPRPAGRCALTGALLFAAALIGTLTLAPAAPAATIRACQKKKSGALRVITGKAKCRRSETALRLSTEGSPGRNGADGRNGAGGRNGNDGAPGRDGAPGLPQKALTFSGGAALGIPTPNVAPLLTLGDVSLRLSCAYAPLAAVATIQATAPAGSLARTGMAVARDDGRTPPSVPQYVVFRPAVGTDTVIAQTFNDGPEVIVGHVSGTITTPTQVVWIDAILTSNTSPTCTASGVAFSIPR